MAQTVRKCHTKITKEGLHKSVFVSFVCSVLYTRGRILFRE